MYVVGTIRVASNDEANATHIDDDHVGNLGYDDKHMMTLIITMIATVITMMIALMDILCASTLFSVSTVPSKKL